MTQAAERILAIEPSATITLTAKARELKNQGKDIISLTIGEPDFATPEHICEAAIAAIRAGDTHYPANNGNAPLIKAIVAKLKNENQLNYDESQILVSCGAKHSIYNLCLALLNPGDEVIVPAPYWVSYPSIVKLAEATPVIVTAGIEQDFKVTAEQLSKAITDKTKLFIINSPSNPTGAAYSKAELQALGEILKQHPQVMILTDDIYEHISWSSEPFCNIATACPDLHDRTFVVNGVSKAYAMTGWRIGYLAGDETILAQAKKLQSQSTSGACSISQAAATEALAGDQSCVQQMTTEFKKRHDFMVAALSKINGFKVRKNEGTFYNFVDVSEIIANASSIKDDMELAAYLLEQAEVAVVPGQAFGLGGYLRISFASSLETLETAVTRIEKAINELQ